MQAKEWGNIELGSIVSHGVGDGLRPVSEWLELLKGSGKVLFLQMQPNFSAHLKLMWPLMLIMSLFVLGIGFIQDVVNLLVDVLDAFNKSGHFINLR